MEDANFVAPTEEELQQRRENEYAYLQRQYRIASNDSARYAKESGAMIRKQEILLHQLQNIKREVMIDLTVAKNPANTVIDDANIMKLTSLLSDSDDLDAEIIRRRTHLKETETEIQKTERTVKQLIKTTQSEQRKWEESLVQRRRESRLDNRLCAETNRLGRALADNQKLRADLEDSLKERQIFNLQYNRLVGKLAEGKKVMTDLIELASVMYDQRQEAQGRLEKLLEQGKRHKDLQTEVMCKLVTQLDMDKELKEFVATKGQRRVLVTMEERCEEKRQREKQRRKELIASYKQILKDISDFTGETDMDRVVNLVLRTEGICFNVYAYALTLHEEIEVIRRDIDKLDAAVLLEKEKEKERKNQRRATLNRLRLEMRETKRQAAAERAMVEKQKHALDNVLARVTKMFDQVQADKTKLSLMLGNNKKATEYNYLRYLSAIEHQMMLLMAQCSYVEANNDFDDLPLEQRIIKPVPKEKFKAIEPSAYVPTNPCSICVETEELCKLEEETVLVPLEKTQVRKKLHQEMARPEFDERMHSLSACRLPRSRKILTRRYM